MAPLSVGARAPSTQGGAGAGSRLFAVRSRTRAINLTQAAEAVLCVSGSFVRAQGSRAEETAWIWSGPG